MPAAGTQGLEDAAGGMSSHNDTEINEAAESITR